MTTIALTAFRAARGIDRVVLAILAIVLLLALVSPDQAVESIAFTGSALLHVGIFLLLSVAVTAYAKQETVGPLRGAGRWLGFGVAGAFALGLGLMLLLLGLLRLLQTEWTRSATGSLSWLAYLITLVVAGAVLALAISRISKSTLGNEPE